MYYKILEKDYIHICSRKTECTHTCQSLSRGQSELRETSANSNLTVSYNFLLNY